MSKTYNPEHYWSINRAACALRTCAVVLVTVVALGISLPNLLESTNPLKLGTFDFITSNNVVIYAGHAASAAGISAGDRIDYAHMSPDERYGTSADGLRSPPAGRRVAFVVDRNGAAHVARLAAEPLLWDADWGDIIWPLRFVAQKAVFLVLVLLASALALAKPSPVTGSFFLFVAGNGVVPEMYSWLPPSWFAVVMATDDALAGLGAIGFFAFALSLNSTRHIRARSSVIVLAVFFAVIVVPIVISDVWEIVGGTRPSWPVAGWASFSALVFCYAAGCALLLRTAAIGKRVGGLRLLAAVVAVVGALTVLDWTFNAQLNTWYFAHLPGVAMNRGMVADRQALLPFWFYTGFLFIFRLLGALLAFYVVVRTGVADAGPVYRRIVNYIIVASLIVAFFLTINVTLMPAFTSYILVVPLEILLALVIGYWVSGLRDLAGSLSLAYVDAWSAWARGRGSEERDVLAQSLCLAERTRRRDVVAEVRAQIAFVSWRNGEDGAFDQKIGALQRVLDGRRMRGIGAFADAVKPEERAAYFDDTDMPEWKARTALVLASRTDDAVRAQQLACDALEHADRAGVPSLQVLASIAVAEACAARRDDTLARAHAIAREAGWPALSASILALRANARDIGLLQTFVEVRLRKTRPARAMFEVSFFRAELCVNGARASLSEKQLELLLTVASSRTATQDRHLMDVLWPESEGDAARNSLRVCLHGLRKSAGDARIVTRVGRGFVLHPWADVDLWRFADAASAFRETGSREASARLDELCTALRLAAPRREALGEWFFPFEQMLERRCCEAERLLTRDTLSGSARTTS